MILESFQGASPANGESAIATYSHGNLHASILFRAPLSGAGQLIVEVLDPEDAILGRTERRVTAVDAAGIAGSRWQTDVPLTKPMSTDDLVWHRLRYRFAPDDHKDGTVVQRTESISRILRIPVVHILGQQSYMTGAPAAVRIIVTDSNNAVIPGLSSVRIDLAAPSQRTRTLFAGRLNARGTTEAQFRFPAGVVGSYPLRYVVDTPIGGADSRSRSDWKIKCRYCSRLKSRFISQVRRSMYARWPRSFKS